MPLVSKIDLKQFNATKCWLMSDIILICFWRRQKHPLSFHISPTPLELLKTIDNEILDTIDNVVLCKTFSLVTAISDNDPDNRWVEFVDGEGLGDGGG